MKSNAGEFASKIHFGIVGLVLLSCAFHIIYVVWNKRCINLLFRVNIFYDVVSSTTDIARIRSVHFLLYFSSVFHTTFFLQIIFC